MSLEPGTTHGHYDVTALIGEGGMGRLGPAHDTKLNHGGGSRRWESSEVYDMTDEDLKAEIEQLRAENERLKKPHERGLSMKVSPKGALSLYGMGRFPVTLYKEQWARLLDAADDIRTFLKENDAQLKSKGTPD